MSTSYLPSYRGFTSSALLPTSMLFLEANERLCSIQLHAAILDLFRPFLCSATEQPLKLARFSAENKTAEHLCLASTNQLKHHILTIRSQHSSATTSFLWHNALLYVANSCLSFGSLKASDERIDSQGLEASGLAEDPHRRLWYMACIDGYRALAPQFQIVNGIVQGLLSMGIRDGLLSRAEGKAIMNGMRADKECSSRFDGQHSGRQPLDEYTWGIHSTIYPESPRARNSFVVDLNMSAVNTHAALLQALVQSLDEMTVFE